MQAIFDWLVTLPVGTFYVVLGLTAALENFLPPFPSDLTVAFGSFLVAQGGRGTLRAVFACTLVGNVGGALIVYALGRRYGAEPLERRLAGRKASTFHDRIARLFGRYGMAAIFVSRFVPGVRAIVPAFAGALRLPAGRVFTIMTVASSIWYGFITWIAWRAGADWNRLRAMLSDYGRTGAIAGSLILIAGVAAWLVVRRRRRQG